jgi:hypothetical protein
MDSEVFRGIWSDLELTEFEEKTKDLSRVNHEDWGYKNCTRYQYCRTASVGRNMTMRIPARDTIAGTQFQPLWETIRIFHRYG